MWREWLTDVGVDIFQPFVEVQGRMGQHRVFNQWTPCAVPVPCGGQSRAPGISAHPPMGGLVRAGFRRLVFDSPLVSSAQLGHRVLASPLSRGRSE